MSIRIMLGDVREQLALLPSELDRLLRHVAALLGPARLRRGGTDRSRADACRAPGRDGPRIRRGAACAEARRATALAQLWRLLRDAERRRTVDTSCRDASEAAGGDDRTLRVASKPLQHGRRRHQAQGFVHDPEPAGDRAAGRRVVGAVRDRVGARRTPCRTAPVRSDPRPRTRRCSGWRSPTAATSGAHGIRARCRSRPI